MGGFAFGGANGVTESSLHWFESVSGSIPRWSSCTTARLGAEQHQIVAKVEELMALVDQLEAQLAASEEVGTKLLDALVAELAPSN